VAGILISQMLLLFIKEIFIHVFLSHWDSETTHDIMNYYSIAYGYVTYSNQKFLFKCLLILGLSSKALQL